MGQRRSFYNKLAYGAAMAVLLVLLSMLSLPQTGGGDKGGKLAQLRSEHGLSQGELGEVDPASETIKLATLGMRGIAVQRLWDYAFEMKKTENWSEFAATLELLAKLQPNFVTFWKYQSWNVSYNISVEFDDYRDRYYYVRRGIDFLKRGQSYNRDSVKLLWEMGWFIGQKIGRSDEKVQYRRLFKADDDYHPEDRPPGQRDNWLVSKDWYNKSVVAADERRKGIGNKSPVIFYSSAAKSQMNFGDAIETEGFFDLGLRGWKRAAEMWRDFGNYEVEHSTGVRLRLNDTEYLSVQVEKLQAELEAMAPGVIDELSTEAREKLDEATREALDTPEGQRTPAQAQAASIANRRLKVSPRRIAERVIEKNPENRRRALALASQIEELTIKLRYIRNYKDVCNFDYWQTRADFEQTENAVRARELIYRGWRAFVNDADPVAAQELFEEGFRSWRAVLDEFPSLWDIDGTTGDDLMIDIVRYNQILEQNEEEIPDDFPLWRIIEEFDVDRELQGQLVAYKQRQQNAEADSK